MPRSWSNDFILEVPYYSRRLPTGRHGTARNFVETGLNRNSRFPNWSPVDGSDFVVFLDFPKVGQMTRTAIGLPRESRSYSPCATHAREDRPARRTLPFFSICFQKLAKRRARSVIRLHAQVISTVVESVFPVSLPPPARAGPRRAAPGS